MLRYISSLYDNTIKVKENFRLKSRKQRLVYYLLKPLFRVDILF
jgi:hypothetical protein